MDRIAALASAMIDYEEGNPGRICHFLKVHGYARAIGGLEGLRPEEMEILEAAALTHDIGIKPSEEKYGSGDGKYQEVEGPPVAKPMLEGLGFSPELVRRVCWLIGHHHTYDAIEGMDYQILVEADFLVNLDEGKSSPEAIRSVREKIFRTEAGRRFLARLFP